MLCTICKLNEVKKVDTCKKCKRVLWKIENKESIRQSALLYRENNKEKIPIYNHYVPMLIGVLKKIVWTIKKLINYGIFKIL